MAEQHSIVGSTLLAVVVCGWRDGRGRLVNSLGQGNLVEVETDSHGLLRR